MIRNSLSEGEFLSNNYKSHQFQKVNFFSNVKAAQILSLTLFIQKGPIVELVVVPIAFIAQL